MPAPNVRVRVVGRAEVEPVRVGEHRRVVVGRAEQQRRAPLPRGIADAADLDVLQHPALEHLQRGVVAHQLLDRGGQQRRVGAQPRQLVGVAEQRPPAVAGHVHGRLVAGVQQQHAGADQLVLGEPVALVATAASALIRSSPRVARGARGPARAGSRRTPRAPARPRRGVLATGCSSYIPQMSADHGRSRCRSASGTPSISAMTATGSGSATSAIRSTAAAARRTSSTSPSAIACTRRPQPLDHARRERLGDQPAQPRVVGRLQVEHAVADEVPERRRASGGGAGGPTPRAVARCR